MLGQLFTKYTPQILSGVSSALGHVFASDRQDDAQTFSAQQFATRYQTTVKDMEAAGLNPALAYQQGGGSPPSSTAASASNFDMSSAQADLIKAQTRKTNAEAGITEGVGMEQAKATLQKTLTDIGLTAAQIAKVDSETTNIIATLNNIKSEDDRLKMAARMLNQQAQLMSAQNTTEAQRQKVMIEQAKLILSQTGLANMDLKAAQDFGNLGREAGQLKPVVDIIKSLLRK